MSKTNKVVPESQDIKEEGKSENIPPDGGWGWIIVCVSFVTNFMGWGTLLSSGVFLEEFCEFFDAEHKTISSAISLAFAFTFFCMPIDSALINKFGNRMVTFVGLLLMCLAVLSITFASAVHLVFFCYAIFGIGNGMIHLSGMVICSEYFDKRRSLAVGICLAGVSCGKIIMPYISDTLLQFCGWQWTFRVFSISFGLISASTFLLRPLEKSKSIEKTNGEDSQSVLSKVKDAKSTIVRWMKNKIFILICLSKALADFAFFMPFTFWPSLMLGLDIDLKRSSYVMGVVGICDMIGRIGIGKLIDNPRVSAFITNTVALCAAGIFLIVTPFCRHYYSFIIVGGLYGIFSAGYAVTTPPINAMAFGMDSLTTTLGVTMFFRGVGSSVGPIVTGFLYDATKTYDYACYLGGGILFLGGILNEVSHKLLLDEERRQATLNKCLDRRFSYV